MIASLFRRSQKPLYGFIAAELLCAYQLITPALSVWEGLAERRELLLALTTLLAWAIIAWSWRNRWPAPAWLATIYVMGLQIRLAYDAQRWWDANMSPSV